MGFGQGCAGRQLEQLAFGAHGSGFGHGCLSWHLALAQLQRPGLSARMVPGLRQESGGREQGGLR